jgi:hypothetical protein
MMRKLAKLMALGVSIVLIEKLAYFLIGAVEPDPLPSAIGYLSGVALMAGVYLILYGKH